MKASDFDSVGLFHEQFGLESARVRATPHHIPPELRDFRLKFLKEELTELEEAYARHDLPGVADADEVGEAEVLEVRAGDPGVGRLDVGMHGALLMGITTWIRNRM